MATTGSATGRAPGPRVRLSRPARRAELLRAAQDVFVGAGYHAASMDEIALRAGVSKPVLYQHFPGKLELYLAVVDGQCEELIGCVEGALATTADNRLRVERTVAAYLDFVDGGGAHRLIFESDLLDEPQVEERITRSMQQCVEAVARTIASDTGVEPAEAELLGVALGGMAQVAARWRRSDASGRQVSKERARELLTTLAWRGISGSPRRLE